jgi:class 3 adenylate cyclase
MSGSATLATAAGAYYRQSRDICGVVKRTGDGVLIEFKSVVDAVRCAIEVQNGMVERNAGLPPERRIEFRVGIHLGDVVEESDGDLMGDGVSQGSFAPPGRARAILLRV